MAFFAGLMVLLSRPGFLQRWENTKARGLVIAIFSLAIAIFFILFAFMAAGEPKAGELVKIASSPGNVYLREAAANNLAHKLDPCLAQEVCRQAVSSSDASQSSILMVASYQDIYNHGDATKRRDAVLCIKAIPSGETSKFIEQVLEKDQSAAVREVAATSLGEIGDQGSIPVLIQTLISENDDNDVTEAAGKALAGFGKASAGPLVKARCDLGADSGKGNRLEGVLIKIGEPGVFPLLDQLGTANSSWAEYVLGEIGPPVRKYLQAKIDQGKDNFNVRCAAAIPLLQMEVNRNPQKIGHLINYLKRRDFAGAAQHVAISYAEFINLGIRGTEYFLIDALNAHANVPMVEDYLNCGNNMLREAATRWAYSHGYIVVQTGRTNDSPKWGGSSNVF